MDNEQAAMVITDPPYNVQINGHVSGKGRTGDLFSPSWSMMLMLSSGLASLTISLSIRMGNIAGFLPATVVDCRKRRAAAATLAGFSPLPIVFTQAAAFKPAELAIAKMQTGLSFSRSVSLN